MERVLSVEEKIKRAEEIYERRRNENYRNTTATVNVSGRANDFKLLKKMIVQILICLLIYFIFYLIQTSNYVFSATTLDKTKEILNYDMDVQGIYTEIKNNLVNNENVVKEDNKENQENTVTIENNTVEQESIQNEEEVINTENEITEPKEATIEPQEKNAEQEEITVAQEILANYSIIKPADGFISSEFGTREEEGDIVTPYHNGIDIGVVTGTEVKSATDGIVIFKAESESYGKYLKIQNGDLITLYAHCNKLNVSEGDEIKQGDIIAESGATGKVTGPHLHFEIIYKGEYINPRDILEF